MRSIVILIFFWSSLTAARENGNSCQITPGPAGEIQARTRQIEFPDGHEIIIIGHNHGDRALPHKLIDFIKRSGSSNEELALKLNQLKSEVQPALRHALQDRHYLKSILSNRPHLTFVALEMTPETLQINSSSYDHLKSDFLQFSRSHNLDLTEALELSLVTFGATHWLITEAPELFARRTLRAFESESSTKIYEDAAAAVESARAALKAASADDERFWRDVEGTDLQLWAQYDSYTPADQLRFMHSIESANIPQAYREKTLRWASARLDEMTALKNREESVARGLVNTGQSGILLMGEKHLDSIALILQKLCLQSRASY